MKSDNPTMSAPAEVFYVYCCTSCGHRGEVHFADDSHDGEVMVCASCDCPVRIEWDSDATVKGFGATISRAERAKTR